MKNKAYLLHLSHYDPKWCGFGKGNEWPFDTHVALHVIDAMGEANMNTLIIGVSDGVIYKSRPELQRHYSAPMKELKKICAYAHKCGIDVVPKLNFSKSARKKNFSIFTKKNSICPFEKNF